MNTTGLPFDSEKDLDFWKYADLLMCNFHKMCITFQERVKLIELLCILYRNIKEKKPDIKIKDIIDKYFPNTSEDMRRELADLCFTFYSDHDKYSSYGIKTGTELIAECRKILLNELPF